MENKKLSFSGLINEFTLIFIGMCFFANPMISLFDVLPDFIGCLIIMYAISKFTAISGDLESAYAYFRYMAFASVARLVVFFINPQFDDVMLLSLTLIFGVIEFICAFLAFPALYDGLTQLSIRYGTGVKDAPEFRTVCLAFFGARGFGAILPHITSVLTGGDDELITNEAMATASYTALLTLVNIVLTVIVAVFFIITAVTFISRLRADKEMKTAITDELKKRNEKEPEFFIRRQLVSGLTLIGISFLCLVDVIGDGVNYLPDFLFGLLAVFGVYKMRDHLENSKPVIISGLVYSVLSAVSFFVYNDFMKRRYPVQFPRIIQNYIFEYVIAIAVAFVETVALIVFISKLAKHLKPIAVTYSIPIVPDEFTRLKAELEETSMLQLRSIKRLRLLGMLVALAGTALVAVLHLTNYFDFPYWMVHALINVALFVYGYVLCYRFRQGVLKRYERPDDVI